jgi:hypothetical protein
VLPATCTITSAGTLAPTAVALPAVGSVALSIRSDDAQVRHVVVRMPARSRALTVPAHGRVSAVLRGIRPGRYVVDVDGLARGLVLVGGAPGSR